MYKKILYTIIPGIFFLFTQCNNDSGGSTTDPFGGGGGGGGTGNVTFTVTAAQGQQGVNFNFKPSTNVTASQITASLPAQQFQDIVNNPNPNEVYDTATGFSIGEYTGVASGQQWTFNIQGKIGSSTGTAYNVNVNFTVP